MWRSRLIILLLACGSGEARPLKLDGVPIVLPAGANEVERFAGEELSRYLEKMSGKRFTIADGAAPASAIVIERATDENGEDGFSLVRRQDHLVLAPTTRRSTLYAVYGLLERLGCRWFAPNFAFYGSASGEYVPRVDSLSVDELDVSEKASFRWRKKYVEEGHTHTTENLKQMIDWMAKARMNVFDCPIDYQHQGKTRWDNWRAELIPELRKRGILIEVGGHGYPNFLPADRYFDAHPEWFGMLKGERSRAPNLVFSTANDAAVREFIANLTGYLKAHPEVDIFDCWPPDGARWSEAPEDVALGNPTERHMLLLSRVARALAPEFPQLKLQFIAYSNYLTPPEVNHPPANLVMDFCPIDRSFESPLFEEKTETNKKYFEALKGWTNGIIAPQSVTLYSYITKYAWRSLPILIPHMIAAESQRYREMGLGGWATYSEPAGWATFELDHYMVGRFAWNASLDADKEIAEYTRARYGKAAGPVAKYLAIVEQVVPHAVGIPGTELDVVKQRPLISRFGASAKLLDEAKQLAGSDAGLATLLDQLDGSRRYTANEMQIRLLLLQAAKGQGRPPYNELEKLLGERRRIIQEYSTKGVIDGTGSGVRDEN